MSAEVQLRVTLQRQLDVAQTHLATLNDKLAFKQAELRAAHAELRCEAPRPVCAHELGERTRENRCVTPTLRSRNERLRRGETHGELAREREDKARAVEEVKHNAMSLMQEVMEKVRANGRRRVQHCMS